VGKARSERAAGNRRDVFPTTQVTRIVGLLRGGDGGRLEAARHVMSVYAMPLEVYLRGSSFRRLGDPADVVEGFFADRLSREGFLADWLDSESRLRYWLIRAFRYYLLEQIRDARKRRPVTDSDECAAAAAEVDDAETAFHREAALRIVAEAFRCAESSCREAGFDEHWRAFVLHHLEGRGFRDIAAALETTPPRACVMARTAASRFRTALRDMVAWNGADEAGIDREIESLMELITR
jgi:DNA-directed RNA polymerase specialized sigma24 family protein